MIAPAVGAALGLAALAWLANAMYFAPRREALQDIGQARAALRCLNDALDSEATLRRDLQAWSDRTLGADPERVVHEFRARLSAIGEAAGLTDLSVTTAPVAAVDSPARKRFTAARNDSVKALGREPDFMMVTAEFRGVGALANAVRAIELIEAEPYPKRVEQFSLRPKKNGETIDLSLTVTTSFLPGGNPAAPLPAPDLALAPGYAAVVQKNIFRAPPPEAIAAAAPPAPPTGPPPTPYEEWLVTAVARIGVTPEVWFRNVRTGETRRLTVGQSVLDATVARIELDSTVVTIGGSEFAVEIGGTLHDRRPASQ